MKIKVLNIGEYVQGGVATYLYSVLSLQAKFDMYAIMSESKSERIWPIEASHIAYYPYIRGLAGMPSAIWAVKRKIAEIRPDVIYCHSTWAGVIGRVAALFSPSCRVVYNAHGWAFLQDVAAWKCKIYAFVERMLAKRTDCIINVSEFEYNNAVRYGLPRDKMVVIYNGSRDSASINPCPIQMDENKINLLFVGRFDPQKGVDFLLKAYERLERADIHLYLIGDNVVSKGESVSMVDSEKKSFLGWIPHGEMSSYYDACDAVIMPSRWEAFGLVCIEAMKYGKPVIASDRGALPELVHPGENGWIFHFDEMGEDLLACLRNLTKDEIKTRSDAARRCFLEHFTEHQMLERTEAVLRDAVESRRTLKT